MKWLWLVLAAGLGWMAWRSLALAAQGPEAGQPAPEFALADQHGRMHRLADYRGRWLVLYFYPKDDTPGCTEQACRFRDDIVRLDALGAAVVGVSVDDSESHARFARKHGLPFPLLADADGAVASRYGALLDLFVAKFARRHTFLIAPDGRVAKAYRSVDPAGHSAEVIEDLRRLGAGAPKPGAGS